MSHANGIAKRPHLNKLLHGDRQQVIAEHEEIESDTDAEHETIGEHLKKYVDLPQAVLGLGITAQIVLMTPEMAETFRSKLIKNQRPPDELQVEAIMRDILANDYVVNGQTISFDKNGRCTDGQHRILACIRTGVAIPVIIICGIDAGAFPSIDGGKPRKGKDALQSEGYTSGHLFSAVVRLIHQNQSGSFRSPVKLTPMSSIRLSKDHPGIQRSVSYGARTTKITHRPAAMGFCHYQFSLIDQEMADDLFEQIITGTNLSHGDPAYAFRRRMESDRGKVDAPDIIFMMFRVWNAFRKGKPLPSVSRPSAGQDYPTLAD